MSETLLLWVLAALTGVGVVMLWRALRTPRERTPESRPSDAPPAGVADAASSATVPSAPAPVVEPPVSAAGAQPSAPVLVPPATPGRAADAITTALFQQKAPDAVAQPPAVVAAPRVAAPPTGVEAEPALALQPASAAAWQQSSALELAAEQLGALGALLSPSGPGGQPLRGALWSVQLADPGIVPIARGASAWRAGLAGRSPFGPGTTQVAWLNVGAAMTFAGTALGARVHERYLNGLLGQVAEIKVLQAALPPRLIAQSEGRLKALTTDLARFVRDARDDYAAAVRRPIYLQRVCDACGQAVPLWQSIQERLGTARSQLAVLARAPRYGEVQLESSLPLLRELQEQRRLQELTARTLAALDHLRLALGNDAADAANERLRGVLQDLEQGLAEDRDVLTELTRSEQRAQGSGYAGKGEFEKNRASGRTLLARLQSESFDALERYVNTVNDAVASGFLDGQALPAALLFRLDDQGQLSELRQLA